MRKPAPQPKKAIVLGLDGAHPELVQQLVREGKLPNFERMVQQSVFKAVTEPFPAVTAPVWTTVATGACPGTHEAPDPFQPNNSSEPADRADPAFDGRNSKAEHLWQAAERAGKRSILVNWETSWPPKGDGIQLEGYGPGLVNLDDLAAELTEEVGPFFASRVREAMEGGSVDKAAFYELQNYQHQWLAKAIGYLVETQPWDLLFVGAQCLDPSGHAQPESGSSVDDRRDNLSHNYQSIDRVLGSLLDLMDSETILAVVCAAGLGSNMRSELPNGPASAHQASSLVIMMGPNIKKGVRPQRLLDLTGIAPTLAYLLDFPVPAQADGPVLWGVMEDPDAKYKEMKLVRKQLDRWKKLYAGLAIEYDLNPRPEID